MKMLLPLFFLFSTVFAKDQTDISDSSRLIIDSIIKTDTSYEFKMAIYSKGGEGDIESRTVITVNKKEITYYGLSQKNIIKNDSMLCSNLKRVINLIENYKNEYDYVSCSHSLDGYFHQIEVWDNHKGKKYRVESGDYEICYYELCIIFNKIDDIKCVFEGKEYQRIIDKLRQHNIPCNRMQEINKKKL